MRHILIHIALLLFAGHLFGQQSSVKVSTKKILIGEEIEVTYKVKTKKGDSILFQHRVDEIPSKIFTSSSILQEGPAFEILEEFKDTTKLKNNTQHWEGVYKVTIWDSGNFILPGPFITINDSTIYFKDVSIEAMLVLPKKDLDLYDIRENYADIPDKPFSILEFLGKWWWAILIVLIIATILFLRSRKKEVEEEPKRYISLKQRTIIAIEALEEEKLWERDKLKEHFVELSYILRSYLTTRYNISLLEKTTRQSKIILSEKGLNDDTIELIIRILSQSDMVKFAKSKPDPIEILRISNFAKQIVAETSPLEIEDAE